MKDDNEGRSVRWRGFQVAAVATAAIGLLACSATTMVTSWKAPNANKATVKKVLVLGVSNTDSLRRTYEDDFVASLTKLGYLAVASYNWVPDASKIDEGALAARIKAEGVTNVLVTRLVGTKEVTTVTAPTYGVGFAPYGPAYYGGWGSYYNYGYATMMSPGYVYTNNVVTLETNFYDSSKEKDALLWSGQTETTLSPSDAAGSKIASVIQAIVYNMRAKEVL
jgi:hypothetical protein